MTIWGFVSDIHGNYAALQRGYQWCEAQGVDRYVCLGDVIGRGDPDACVAWVRDHASIAIVGNRDLDYIDRVEPDLQEVVRSWGHEGRASDFIVSHGDPKFHKRLNSGAIRDEFRRAEAFMEEANAFVWLFGHTHNARIWWLQSAGPELLIEKTIALAAGARYAVNVGTTGMPFPGKGPASIATYDDQNRVLRIVPLSECGPAVG